MPDPLKPFSLWMKIDTTGGDDACQPWTGIINPDGYGRVGWHHRVRPAHRVALSIATGVDLSTPLLACHTCDNRACCNPRHLYWGTYADNSRDAAVLGKFSKKLTADQVVEIRSLWPGMTQKAIAAKFGISRPVACKIVRGKAWRHLG
jgi:hypothetical protein